MEKKRVMLENDCGVLTESFSCHECDSLNALPEERPFILPPNPEYSLDLFL